MSSEALKRSTQFNSDTSLLTLELKLDTTPLTLNLRKSKRLTEEQCIGRYI